MTVDGRWINSRNFRMSAPRIRQNYLNRLSVRAVAVPAMEAEKANLLYTRTNGVGPV